MSAAVRWRLGLRPRPEQLGVVLALLTAPPGPEAGRPAPDGWRVWREGDALTVRARFVSRHAYEAFVIGPWMTTLMAEAPRWLLEPPTRAADLEGPA